MSKKLLIISDSPAGQTGLGRICRELTTRIHLHMSDTFTVATLGMGGQYSSRLRWPQYQIRSLGANRELLDLPEVLRDFANGEPCILFAIWNPGWLEWLAHPDKCEDKTLKACLTSDQFQRWIYAPVDGDFSEGVLPASLLEILGSFDRTLAYCGWAAGLIGEGCAWLPHGVDTNVFYARDKKIARASFLQRIARLPSAPLPDDMLMIGVNATNSGRKNWPMAFAAVSDLVKRGVNVALWAHTNEFYGEYDFNQLTSDSGLNHRVIATKHYLSSDALAWAWSAMDCSLGIGSGEGFGFPIFESLACETPCIHGDYAGAAEFLPDRYKIPPSGFLSEGVFSIRRPAFDPSVWADKIMEVARESAHLPEGLSWESAWPRWREWLLAGVK
jgi:glycosyltransferase involved in cell wall biosynthesis